MITKLRTLDLQLKESLDFVDPFVAFEVRKVRYNFVFAAMTHIRYIEM